MAKCNQLTPLNFKGLVLHITVVHNRKRFVKIAGKLVT